MIGSDDMIIISSNQITEPEIEILKMLPYDRIDFKKV